MSGKTFYVDQVFLERFRKVVLDNKLDAPEVGKIMKVERKAVYGYLDGMTQPKVAQLIMFCKATKTSANWLLGLED